MTSWHLARNLHFCVLCLTLHRTHFFLRVTDCPGIRQWSGHPWSWQISPVFLSFLAFWLWFQCFYVVTLPELLPNDCMASVFYCFEFEECLFHRGYRLSQCSSHWVTNSCSFHHVQVLLVPINLLRVSRRVGGYDKLISYFLTGGPNSTSLFNRRDGGVSLQDPAE